MQYPVPQFTEVEDRLIGPLSIKQFFILFLAGILIFGGYSATKSVVAIVVLFLIFGLPALALTFFKINGRPAYKQMPFLIHFITASKRLVFHKEASSFNIHTKLKDIGSPKTEEAAKAAGDTQTRLREVQTILQKQAEEEAQLVGKVNR